MSLVNFCNGWIQAAIGSPASGLAEFDACSPETITISSAGAGSSTADKQRMVQQRLCGNGELIAKIESIGNNGYAGVEFRADNTPGAIKTGLKITSTSLLTRYVRSAVSGSQTENTGMAPNQRWFKLVRTGNQVMYYQSSTGANWTMIGAQNINLPNCVRLGVFVESINNASAAGVFSNLSVSDFSLSNNIPVTTLSFAADTLQAAAGDTVQVCVNIADACACSPASVQVALQGSGSPHLTTYSTQTLQFQNGDTQKCFSLPIAAAPGNGTYTLSLQNAAGGNGASEGNTPLVLAVTGAPAGENGITSGGAVQTDVFGDNEISDIFDRFGNTYSVSSLDIFGEAAVSSRTTTLQECDCNTEFGISTGIFNLFFEDCDLGTGTGFDAPGTDGSARRRVACEVFGYLATVIGNNVNACNTTVLPKVNIQIQPSFTNDYYNRGSMTPFSPMTAGYGSPYYNDRRYGVSHGLPWIVINTGTYPLGFENRYHGVLRMNFEQNSGFVWHTDLNSLPADPQTPQHDLYSAILREALHILDFGSLLHPEGRSMGILTTDGSGVFSAFDGLIRLVNDPDGSVPNGTHLIVNNPPGSFIWYFNPILTAPGDIQGSCIAGSAGPDMVIAGAFGNYPVFTGAQFTAFQSYSHLDPNCPAPGAPFPYVMRPVLFPNTAFRTIHLHELDILRLIGYQVSGLSTCSVGAAVGSGCLNTYGTEFCQAHEDGYLLPVADILQNDLNVTGINSIQPAVSSSGSGVLEQISGQGYYRFFPALAGIVEILYTAVGCNGLISNTGRFYINVVPGPNCAGYCDMPPAPVQPSLDMLDCHVYDQDCNPNPCNQICNPSVCVSFCRSMQAVTNNHESFPLFRHPNASVDWNFPGWTVTSGIPLMYFIDLFFDIPAGFTLPVLALQGNETDGNSIGTTVRAEAGKNYLFAMKHGMRAVAPYGSPNFSVRLIQAQGLTPTNSADQTIQPVYAGPERTLVEGFGAFRRTGMCIELDVSSPGFDMLWFYNRPYQFTHPSSQRVYIDDIEFIEDNFSAGEDQISPVCFGEVFLGGPHCMLSGVEIRYEWFELDAQGQPAGTPFASYRVRDGVTSNATSNVDPATLEVSISPAATTTYRLRRTVMDSGDLFSDLELCTTEDDVEVFVVQPVPSAAFTYTETDCIADFSSLDPTPGLQHLWVLGNTGQTSTAQHPSGIAFPEGVHLVTHTVTGPCGTDEQTLTLTIQNCCTAPPPAATFEAGALDDCGLFGFRILTQGSGALTFTWNVDGQTYTGLEAEHSFTASGDYLLTLTVTNACGQSVTYKEAISIKQPTADAAFSPFVYCLDAVFTPAHTDGTHLWDFGDGATSSSATAQHTYAAPGAYTVTHTYTEPICGAQAVQTLSITVSECDLSNFSCPCTEPNSINIDAGNGELLLSNLIAAGIMPAGSVSNRCIAIRGSLRVDADYALVFCEVRMQPAAGIVVESFHTLGLSSVSRNGGIYGCNQMWRGIRVEPQARLNSRSSWIADAQYAVEAMDKSNVLLQSNTFRRNYTGLFFNAGGEFNLENFADNTLDGADPLLPPFAGQTPAPGMRPFAGVDVSSQSNLSIGVAGAQPNRFLHLRNGIITNNTNTFVRNSTFEGILRTNTEPNYPFTGFAVRHSGGAAHALTLEGLGKNAAATFHNCTEGVWATGTDVDVQEARMTAMSVGVTVQQGAERSLEVLNNNISATARGIQVFQSPQAALISIRDNEVTAGLAPPLFSKAIAIRADGSSAVQGAGIRNNEVATLGSDLGISLNACAGFEVDNNEVEVLSADNAQGILMAGGSDNILSNNIVTGLLGTGNGVWLNGAGNIRLWCNTLSKLGMGLQLSGQHSGADIATTLFRTPMGTGLRYANGVLAPQQNGRGNRWEGAAQDYSVAAARHEGGDEQGVENARYFVHQDYDSNLNFNFFPPSIALPNVDPSTEWFIVDEVAFETCTSQPQFQAEDEMAEKLRRKVAQDSIANFAEGVQWDAGMQLYLRLLQKPELLNQDTLWAGFFTRYGQTQLGKLAQLEHEKAAMFAASQESEDIAVLREDIRRLSAELQVIDSLAAADSLYQIPPRRAEILAEAVSAVENMEQLEAVLTARRMALADSLLVQNAAITGAGDPAKYQKEFNAIYLAKLAQNNFVFTPAEKEALDAIAAQCPEFGGHAVFAARALRALYNEEVIEDNEDCHVPQQSLRTSGAVEAMFAESVKGNQYPANDADFRIFPNPAQNRFTVTYSLAQPAELRLYDMYGKVRLSTILPGIQAGREDVTVQQLQAGVYSVLLLQHNGEMLITRLLIVH